MTEPHPSGSQSARAFIAALPKTDLHLHLVGSASPETVVELSRRHPEERLPTTLAQVRALYAFTGFRHFLEVYTRVAGLVRTRADILVLVDGLARDAAASNVRYAEVAVTAAEHFAAGTAAGELAEALAEGRAAARERHGVTLNWIIEVGAPDPATADRATDFAVDVRPPGTVAVGLGGPEVGRPRVRFAEQFARAGRAGLHRVCHAGETVGAEQVWSAVRDLGAGRIGHGIGAAEDPALLAHLRDSGTAVEVCPSSNLATRAVGRMGDHPLPVFLAHGVPVTVCSDDPGMFATTLDREYRLLADAFGLGPGDLAGLAATGARAAFMEPADRAELLADIEATLVAFTAATTASTPGATAPVRR
ncbi:adenosine deaminase [Streptacidiphilus sp. P02-A3a]|uniref:adenosine deaminase n=1 Tax=Streptacidiphilus sp. P02-A3a TaxID=2704468 RepID=UPI0015FD3225|nr:adenosine deaminase [Streptacidiphilus sp. P02-A3a]QMU71712.1 adenosine deaminase [Streptacidiphilus sp. P02-A3a]